MHLASVDYRLVAYGLLCVVVAVKRYAGYPQGRKEIRYGVFYYGRYRIKRWHFNDIFNAFSQQLYLRVDVLCKMWHLVMCPSGLRT